LKTNRFQLLFFYIEAIQMTLAWSFVTYCPSIHYFLATEK
jgi:hypothetical protein